MIRKLFHSRTPSSSRRTSNRRRFSFETLENRAMMAGVYPNDPGFAQQWSLDNTGQAGGIYDADLDGPEAWAVTTGSMATVVAVLDSGVDYDDPDLYQNVWLNQAEIPANIVAALTDTDNDGLISFRDLNDSANSSLVLDVNANGYIDGGDLLADPSWENGVDEDGNGHTDDLVGWDFHDNDNDPRPEISGGIYQSHGTGQAQQIGAMTNNGVASAGINWNVRLIPVRIRAEGLVIENVNAAAGIDYAVASGAPISNNSWRAADGGYVYSQEIYEAIARARQAGHLFIAAAGNDRTNNDVSPLFPASYALDNIISATPVNGSNELTGNYGQTTVHLGVSHPGGSSGASSHTSGVAALLKSVHPEWSYTQLKNHLLATVDPLPALSGITVSGGRLNAANALGVVQVTPQTKFYVVNDATQDRTYEYGATGAPVENYALNTGNSAPRGAASTAAGDKTWVVDANKKVYVYSTTGALLGSWTAGSLASNAIVEGIATNGADVWIVDARKDRVYRYTGAAGRLSDSQNATSSFALNSGNRNPKGITTDGQYLWVVNDNSTDKVFKYTLSGSLVGSWAISSGGGRPTGITLDLANMSDIWIVDSSSDRVYQYTAAATRTSGSQSPATSFALAAGNTNPQGIADPPTTAKWSARRASAPAESTALSTQSKDNSSVSLIDAASLEQLFAEPESTWTRKSRIKMRV
ncbi:MAG: S8 family serine peptidase [Pirellulales bacterium]